MTNNYWNHKEEDLNVSDYKILVFIIELISILQVCYDWKAPLII